MLSSQVIQWMSLGVMALLYAAAFVLGVGHMRRRSLREEGAGGRGGVLPHDASMGAAARGAVVAATLLGIVLLIWRGISLRSAVLPVSDPFDAFLLLGLLLAFMLVYFRWTRHLRSLSFFLVPMIVIVLLIGLGLSIAHPSAHADVQGADGPEHLGYRQAWTMLHVATIVAGSVCFALSCVGGVVYLLADRQLRHKGQTPAHRWFGYPPLASIEKFNKWMIYVGFPLLTIATVAGILRIMQAHAGWGGGTAADRSVGNSFKIACGILAWLVYGILVHVPLTPSFRGKRAAWLSVVGFALFIGAFIAARWN